MEASVQSDDKFQRVPPDPPKINWEFWSGGGGGGAARLILSMSTYDSPSPRAGRRSFIVLLSSLRFPEQMKLSVGGRLRPDSCSSLSLQSLANKYVGFQSCHRRHWTLGQGAKRRAKAFPSPCNLFSMSLVTSPGHPFSMSRPQGPQGPRSHTLPVGRALHASLSIWQSSLFFLSSEHLFGWRAEEPEITRRVNSSKKLFWQNVIRRNVGGEGGGRPRPADWLWGGTHSSTPFLLVSSAKVEEEEKPTVVMWAELRQLHLTHEWSSSLATLCIIGWLLHVCHCVTKTDRGAKVRGDCVLMFLSFFSPLVFNIYESRIMTTAPKHNHQPRLPPWPLWTSVKEKEIVFHFSNTPIRKQFRLRL